MINIWFPIYASATAAHMATPYNTKHINVDFCASHFTAIPGNKTEKILNKGTRKDDGEDLKIIP